MRWSAPYQGEDPGSLLEGVSPQFLLDELEDPFLSVPWRCLPLPLGDGTTPSPGWDGLPSNLLVPQHNPPPTPLPLQSRCTCPCMPSSLAGSKSSVTHTRACYL